MKIGNKQQIDSGIVKKKYHIMIKNKPFGVNEKETSRSFMIYDYTGLTTLDSIKKRLEADKIE